LVCSRTSHTISSAAYGSSDSRVDRRRVLILEEQKQREVDEEELYVHPLFPIGPPLSRKLEELRLFNHHQERKRQEEQHAKREQDEAEKARMEQIRRRVCAESDELKELRSKLRFAIIERERAAQVLEKQHRMHMSDIKEAEFEGVLAEEAQKLYDRDKERDRDAHAKRMEVRKMQLDQIAERDRNKEISMKEYENEKKEIDQATELIRAKALAERDRKQAEERRIRQHLLQFMEEQTRLKQEKLELERAEERRALEHIKALEERQRKTQEQKAIRDQERARAFFRVATQLSNDREAQERAEQLRNDLYLEELTLKTRDQEQQKRVSQMNERLQMLACYEQQLAEKSERIRNVQFEEEKERERLIAEFERTENLEMLNNQKRREKISAFHKELNNIIAHKRDQFEREKAAEEERSRRDSESQQVRANIIEEERERIINEYNSLVLT